MLEEEKRKRANDDSEDDSDPEDLNVSFGVPSDEEGEVVPALPASSYEPPPDDELSERVSNQADAIITKNSTKKTSQKTKEKNNSTCEKIVKKKIKNTKINEDSSGRSARVKKAPFWLKDHVQ